MRLLARKCPVPTDNPNEQAWRRASESNRTVVRLQRAQLPELHVVEREVGVEPTLTVWKTAVLPLHHSREEPHSGVEPEPHPYQG